MLYFQFKIRSQTPHTHQQAFSKVPFINNKQITFDIKALTARRYHSFVLLFLSSLYEIYSLKKADTIIFYVPSQITANTGTVNQTWWYIITIRMSHPSIQKAVAQNPFNNFKLHQWRNLTCLPPPSRNHKEVASHTACGKAVAAPPPPPKPCRAPPPSSRNRPRAGLPRTSCPQQGRICCLLGAGQSFRPCACVAWCVLGRPSPRMPRRWR